MQRRSAHKAPGAPLLKAFWWRRSTSKQPCSFWRFLPQFTTPAEPLLLQLVLLGSICVALNTLVDVMAVLGAQRLLKSGLGRSARARLMTRASGVTMIGLGAWLALS